MARRKDAGGTEAAAPKAGTAVESGLWQREDRNYYSSFILVAPDCSATTGIVPAARGGKPTVPALEYQLISAKPYFYTQDELQFEVHARHRGIAAGELKSRRHELLADYFSRPRACLRCSSLPKIYGWGIHFDAEGKIGLHAVDTREYRRFARDKGIEKFFAMRSWRDKAEKTGQGDSQGGLKAWRKAFATKL